MRTHVVLVINPHSGQGSRDATKLVGAARKLGIEPHRPAVGEGALQLWAAAASKAE